MPYMAWWMRRISRCICSSVSCVSNARFCLLRLKLVTWFLFSYASRDRERLRGSKVNGNRAPTQCIAYRHPCDCQLGLLVSVLGSLLAIDLFVFFIRLAICPVTSVYRRRAMYILISLIASTHSPYPMCVACALNAHLQGHPQGQNGAQSEHFSHSLLYSLAFTCEHDNKTPFVRR